MAFGNLKKWFEGATAQVNPFDGGKTWSSVTKPQAPISQANSQWENNSISMKQPKLHGISMGSGMGQRTMNTPLQGAGSAPTPRGVGDTSFSVESSGVQNLYSNPAFGSLRKAGPQFPQSIESPLNVAAKREGQQLVDTTAPAHKYTRNFRNLLKNSNPQLRLSIEANSEINGHEPAGTWEREIRQTFKDGSQYYRPERLSVHKDNGRQGGKATLTHEGLHAAWDKTPVARQQFPGVYDQVANDPRIQAYLESRLDGYQSFQKAGGKKSLSNFRTLPESVQTEIHSYLPEYIAQPTRVPFATPALPQNMRNYYSNHFNLDGMANDMMLDRESWREIAPVRRAAYARSGVMSLFPQMEDY